MEKLNLKKQQVEYLKLQRIIVSIVFLLILIGVGISLYFSPASFLESLLVMVLIVAFYIGIYVYQGVAYKHFSYAMSDYGLYINQGVFWRRKIIVPRNRVQHTDVIQGPLERKFDLAELVVHTAGTRNASVKLLGISHATAEELRESLSFEESNDAV